MAKELSKEEWNKVAKAWLDHHSRKHWDRLTALYGAHKLGPMPETEISWRLTRGYAMAVMYHPTKEYSATRYAARHLAPLENRNAFELVVIPHELCHHAAYRLFGDHCHGKGWQKLMKQLGLSPDLRIDATKFQAPAKFFNPETQREERI